MPSEYRLSTLLLFILRKESFTGSTRHLPDTSHPIGKYGHIHMDYLRKCHRNLYQKLILQVTLNRYLSDTEGTAQRMMDSLIRNMIRQEGMQD